MKLRFGFTLIEILVVISIIAILAGVGLATFSGAQKKSRDAKRKADLETIRSALEMYRADNGEYPLRIDETSGWEISNDGDWLENLPSNYLSIKPLDPKHPVGFYRYGACKYTPNPPQTDYKLMVEIESGNNTHLCPSCDGYTGNTVDYCIANP